MDYGKHKYENEQRAKEARKKASNVVVKEMKYRPKISSGDFETKTRKVEKFLGNGNKVKVTIMFRGREVTHPELGRKILDDIIARVDDYAQVEAYPRLDGRNMTMVLGPDTKKKKKLEQQQRQQAKKEAAEAARRAETSEGAEEATPAEASEPAETTESEQIETTTTE